jgi:hypothetical protein
MGLSTEGEVVSYDESAPSEGRLSRDATRVERAEVRQLSLVTDASSSGFSSGGLSKTSIGLRLKGE